MNTYEGGVCFVLQLAKNSCQCIFSHRMRKQQQIVKVQAWDYLQGCGGVGSTNRYARCPRLSSDRRDDKAVVHHDFSGFEFLQRFTIFLAGHQAHA